MIHSVFRLDFFNASVHISTRGVGMKILFSGLVVLAVVSSVQAGDSIYERIERGEIPSIEELFPPLFLDPQLETFLKGKKFESGCIQTVLPPQKPGEAKKVALYPSYRYTYEFDGQQDQVVHRWVRLFKNATCQDTCSVAENTSECHPQNYVASFGGQAWGENTFKITWRADFKEEPDLMVIDPVTETFQLGDRSSANEEGFPTRGDPHRTFTLVKN